MSYGSGNLSRCPGCGAGRPFNTTQCGLCGKSFAGGNSPVPPMPVSPPQSADRGGYSISPSPSSPLPLPVPDPILPEPDISNFSIPPSQSVDPGSTPPAPEAFPEPAAQHYNTIRVVSGTVFLGGIGMAIHISDAYHNGGALLSKDLTYTPLMMIMGLACAIEPRLIISLLPGTEKTFPPAFRIIAIALAILGGAIGLYLSVVIFKDWK